MDIIEQIVEAVYDCCVNNPATKILIGEDARRQINRELMSTMRGALKSSNPIPKELDKLTIYTIARVPVELADIEGYKILAHR